MNQNYWSRTLALRINRRRGLAAAGGFAAGASLLAACGDDDKSGSSDKSGLLSPREDESAKAVAGGTFKTAGAPTGGTIDPHVNNASGTFSECFTIYSTPLKWGRAIGKMPASTSITGDAFESWEIAPDGQQITLKLRPNHKFDSRPPTNGRAMTVEDVKWSWDRSSARSAAMGEVLNAKGDAGPLLSLATPDDRTVTIKLAFPYGAITELLSFWYFFILPKEADGQFDPRQDGRGSGPFQLVKFEPSGTGIEYRRNPDWYVKGRPLLDGFTSVSIPEYAAALAQFEAGSLWTLDSTSGVKQEDVLRVKRDHPKMVLRQKATAFWSLPHQVPWVFSQREDSPFKDIRLRHAVSNLYDADAFIETFYNVRGFTAAGLPFDVVRDTHISTQAFNWIDPRDKSFGPNAKYLEYNLEEAKKLIAASGFTGTIDLNSRGNSPQPQFGPSAEVFAGMLQAGGLKVAIKPQDPNTTWRRYKEEGYEAYSGMYQNTVQAYSDDALLVSKYTPSGRNRNSSKPIPGITERVIKMQTELNLDRRNEMIKQLQKDLAQQMLDKPLDYDQKPYWLHWPWLRNYNVFTTLGFDSDQNTSGRTITEYWYDATQKT
jgi:ABC-type transport system substrate-binding protein